MIFFDIDATLLDHEKAEELAAIEFFKSNHRNLSYNESNFVKRWFEVSVQYFDKFPAKEISFQEQRRCRIKEFCRKA